MLSNTRRDTIQKLLKTNPIHTLYNDDNIRDLMLEEEAEEADDPYENTTEKVENLLVKNGYYYKAYDLLRGSDMSVNPLIKDLVVDICIFSINNTLPIPFIEFCLNKKGGILSMKTYKCLGFMCDDIGIITQQLENEFDTENVAYKGFYVNNSRISLWFNINKLENNKENVEWCLVDDIMNKGNSFSFKINENVATLLKNEFITLVDKSGIIYETPISGYYSKTNKNHIIFTFIYGRTREKETEYYYYDKDVPSVQSITEGGIVKFALFVEDADKIIVKTHNRQVAVAYQLFL